MQKEKKISYYKLCCAVCVTCFFLLYDQQLQAQNAYPQNYFRNPLDIPIQLAANFGELRTNHFHMGLDIRTQSKENLPVYAAADGYISKIKIEKYGYGRAIYITHPNGYTTLYAHLNDFYPDLQNFIIQKQYADKSWAQEIILQPNQFPIIQGQFIANSGNTGGSQGPHLHFEIRDSKTDKNINPELCGFPITDNIAPLISTLYLYDRRNSIYQVEPLAYSAKKSKENYIITAPIILSKTQLPGFAIRAEDKNNGSSYKFGIYSADMYMDDSLLFGFELNNFNYTDSRYVNACMDYKKFMSSKTGIQYLFELPGNQLKVFKPTHSKGVVILTDTITHNMRVEVKDVTGNFSTLLFKLKYDTIHTNPIPYPADAKPIVPGKTEKFVSTHCVVSFSDKAFYDRVPFSWNQVPTADTTAVSPAYQLYNWLVPVHDYYAVQLKTNLPANSVLRNKTIMKLVSGKDSYYEKGSWEGDWMKANFRRLGIVCLLYDTIAPQIAPIAWKDSSSFDGKKSMVIKCTDNNETISRMQITCDGQWLLFAEKGNTYTFKFDDKILPGFHQIMMSATDLAGNKTEKTFTIKKL